MTPRIAIHPSKTYRIVSFRNTEVALRMLSMGILPGDDVTILTRSPFGGCYFVSVGNRWIAARAEELSSIEWIESPSLS